MLVLRHALSRMITPAAGRLILGAALVGGPLHVSAQDATPDFEPKLGQSGRDVIWLPTPNELITTLLTLAAVTPKDQVVDLGSGDGKIVIAAARDFKAQARGVEYDPRMVALSKSRAQDEGVSELTEFVQDDIFKHDFTDATVVAMYLLPEINLRLRPKLMAMKPGTRIVTHFFDMGRWQPDESIEASFRPGYLWVVPANAGGTWNMTYELNGKSAKKTLKIDQSFQQISAQVLGEKAAAPASASLSADRSTYAAPFTSNGKVNAYEVTFNLPSTQSADSTVAATLKGDQMTGTVTQGTKSAPFKATRQGSAPAIDGSGEPTEDEYNAARLALGTE